MHSGKWHSSRCFHSRFEFREQTTCETLEKQLIALGKRCCEHFPNLPNNPRNTDGKLKTNLFPQFVEVKFSHCFFFLRFCFSFLARVKWIWILKHKLTRTAAFGLLAYLLGNSFIFIAGELFGFGNFSVESGQMNEIKWKNKQEFLKRIANANFVVFKLWQAKCKAVKMGITRMCQIRQVATGHKLWLKLNIDIRLLLD